ncbi:MAG: FHA domain-containing protein [Candidatus Eremiobacteraeota bacterium]|nr:FHA domain-containing protein [Candidatus Eremiobacteraeota bacterium]
MIALEPHWASLVVVAATLAYVVAAQPRRRVQADDTLAMLASVELRIEELRGTRTVRLPVPILIGRSPEATVVLADPQVSRLHARIDVWNGEVAVRDLQSRNGTWLNARPIDEPVPLRAGDELELGSTRVVFCGVGPLASPADVGAPQSADERNSAVRRQFSPQNLQ